MINLGGTSCNNLKDLCIPMKLARLIKMCLKETYRRVPAGKHLSNIYFTIPTSVQVFNTLKRHQTADHRTTHIRSHSNNPDTTDILPRNLNTVITKHEH